jgi:hypothetical protein
MQNKGGLIATLFAWNDLLLSVFAACILIFGIMITQIQQLKKEETDDIAHKTGSVAVFCFWADGIDADVDIHTLSPDGVHMFYQRPQTRVWSMMRDDLGKIEDPGERNFENAATRGLDPGKYVVNVHAYRAAFELYPIEVDCEIVVTPAEKVGRGEPTRRIKNKVLLRALGDEQTIASFIIDHSGKLIESSVDKMFTTILRRG